jgi:outer membrane protein OmpA-like peptidoglycan-associated protein/type II secretory pathway predicted ATPase ExeA
VEIMTALKHFGQMHKPIDMEMDTIPKADSDSVEALATLRQAMESGHEFILLTGPEGAGKSKLVQELLPHLTCMVSRVTIPDREMTNQDFRQFLAEALGLEAEVQSRGAFLLKIRDFLMSEAVKDHRIILVLESIQCLKKKLFKEFELLSDIRIRDRDPITILFVGLTEAESIFNDPYLAKINNRIFVKIRLKDADSDDVGNLDDVRRHIRERLQQAGTLEPVFDAFAVREVYRLSRGRLWVVDGLFDLALLNGSLHGLKKIPAAVVGEYARQLGLPVKGDGDRELFQRNLESVRQKLQNSLDAKAPPESDTRVGLQGAHLGHNGRVPGADPTVLAENADQLETLTQPHKDRDFFQPGRASTQQKPQSELDNNLPSEPGDRVEPEAVLPLDSGLESDAGQGAMNQFQEGDWDDRVLMQYIDRTHLNREPVPQRPEGQWYDSTSTQIHDIDDDWETDPVASGPVLNRSSFMWGALSVISVLLIFFAVWIQFFDESGNLSRFFTDTAVKIESALLSIWQGDSGDATPESAAKPSPPSSETIVPEPANPASPERDSAADAWPLQTGSMIQFDSNSYEIGPEYAKLLDRVAAYLERHPEHHVSLRGYSDNIGSRDYNLFISRYRALVVKYYLIGKGVSAERMQILGMGQGSPVGSNDTPEGRRHNRRVEIKLIQGSSPNPGVEMNPLPFQHQLDFQPEDLIKK